VSHPGGSGGYRLPTSPAVGEIATPYGVVKVLGTDGIVFAGAVLTNLAIACYRKPGVA
jgi:hypothetical protein